MAQKLFISYARKDARELALRLQADLQADGFEAWLDTSEIVGGASWSSAIEDAIETCTTALALLSAGSYVSEICRAEQLRCLRKGKQVIPLLVQADAERPVHLESLHYRDFTNSADYFASLNQLLSDIRDAKPSASNGKVKETYTNAPALPLNFVERPEQRDKLRQELIADDGERRIAITALQGMGGIGKSALAAWICRDDVVQSAFPDGIIWVDVGRENVNLLELTKLVGTKLGDSMGHYSSDVAALSRLRETLTRKSALIVLDDVWHLEHAKAFSDIEAPCSRVLFTTRDSSIGESLGASELRLGVMKPEQAFNLLREWAGRDFPEMPEIAKKLGYLPLALKIAGGRLKEMNGQEWLETFQAVSSLKGSRRDITPTGNLEVCFDLSVQRLGNADRILYHGLGIFPEDLWIPETVAFKLWQAYNPRLKIIDCREIARDLHKLALVERRDSDGAMYLHDILHDYNRERLKERAEYHKAHQKLLARYKPDEKQAWWELEPDGYIYENLAYHLLELRLHNDLHKLLTASPTWMEAKYLHCMGDSAYVADLSLAMKSYNDPIPVGDLLKWVELNTARQVVNARVGTFNDDLLRVLVYRGREKEAINHARLRPKSKEQFDGMYAIWKILKEESEGSGIELEELLQVVQGISSLSEKASVLTKLATSLAQAQNPQADAVFSQAQQVAQSILNMREQSEALSSLAVCLAQAQRFDTVQQVAENISDSRDKAKALSSLAVNLAQAQNPQADAVFSQAQQVAQSILDSGDKAKALSSLAVNLAQAQMPQADAVFSQAQQVAQSISDSRDKAKALSSLAVCLAQAQQFDAARQVIQSISFASDKGRALSSLAVCLAQAQQFDAAQQVAQNISSLSEKASVLTKLATSLVQAQMPQADAVFSQAQQVAQSILNTREQSEALSSLAVNLAQAQKPQADAVFSQAQQVAQSISNTREQSEAVKELAVSLAQAQRFDAAQHVAQSISNTREQSEALSSLVVCLAQAQQFGAAQQVAQSIADTYQQVRALKELVVSLAQAQQFDAAQHVAQSIPNTREQSEALSSLAVSLAQAQMPQADDVFSQAQHVAQHISFASEQAEALKKLAISLIQAQRFEQAQHVAQSISFDHYQAEVLKELIASLIREQRFEQAQQVAQSISNTREQSEVLSSLAVSLAQVQQFDQAHKVAQNISDAYQQIGVLSSLAVSLAQVQQFDQAHKVAQNISDAYQRIGVLSSIAVSISQAQKPQADALFSQVYQVAKSISNNYQKERILNSLAVSLIQAQWFEQAQQVVKGISDVYQKERILNSLAVSLIQAQQFEQAQKVAQDISFGHYQEEVLKELISSLIQAQRFEQAQHVAQSISDVYQRQIILGSLAVSLAQARQFEQAQQVARSISFGHYQEEVLKELVARFAQAGLYEQRLFAFGMRAVDETIKLLALWQRGFSHTQGVWDEVIPAALEIVCWQRKDYEPIRDILREL